MEYSYSRELKHNYLIVKRDSEVQDEKREKSENYQIKIMESGKVKGFIPCDRRIINNRQFLYYEINSKQSIKDRFSTKGMSLQQVRQFLSDLRTALLGVSDYLLGIESVVFDTSSVFYDLNTGEFKFMYCPFYKEETGFDSFADELFDLVDHDDEKAVEMVYDLSEQAHNEGFLVLDLVEKLLEDTKEETPEISSLFSTVEYVQDEDIFEDVPIEEEVPPEPKKSFSGKAQLVFGALFVLVIAAMMYIRMNYILSSQENMLSIIVMLVSVISALAAFISGAKEMSRKESTESKEKIAMAPVKDDPVTFESYDNYIDETSFKMPVKVKAPVKKTFEDSCETVILGMDEVETPMTLYSSNMDKTLRISLDKLPLTIGKLEGCVDRVISDNSISRIHCKIMENRQGRPVIVDLNSTNGTFRNGLRLRPQEEMVIEEGDEVRIGRICFDCR